MVDEMNKIILPLSLLFVWGGIAMETAFARELKEPNFFIPEKDRMHKAEVLPPIQVLMEDSDWDLVQNMPNYKRIYNKYLERMKIFAKEGKITEDSELNESLEKMQSGNVFEVTQTVPENSATKEYRDFICITENVINN